MKNPDQKKPIRSRLHRILLPSQFSDFDVYVQSKMPITKEEAFQVLVLVGPELKKFMSQSSDDQGHE